MKKETIFILLTIMIIILITGFITNYIDNSRVKTKQEPKFCVKVVNNDGSRVTYFGLGYKIIRYVGVSPNEPYTSNIGVQIGSWFMKYKSPLINSKNNKEECINIKSLDDFYNVELTRNKDIRSLRKQYSSFDAQKDNCFVIGAMVHNDYLYTEFMDNYKNKKNSFIRVVQSTIKGDTIVYDILYYEKTDKLYLVTDNIREESLVQTDKKIELKEFECISEYNFKNHLYWILYNEEVNERNFNSDNVFIITTIN